MTRDLDSLMEFAARTAERAGRVALEHFGRAEEERKDDGSEVTVADREAEALVRRILAESFPDDAVFGEEEAATAGTSGRRWIVDPIDGTRSFAAGVPLFGVLIALEEGGEPLLGCCHLPVLQQTLVAATGAGAWLNGRRARVSTVDDPAEARVVTSGLEYWRDWATEEGRAGFDRLLGGSRYGRTWGDCFGYVQVATGRAEIMVDPAVGSYWDFAPLVPIVAEAGGRFTTIGGGPVGAWTSALATNGALHAHAAGYWEARARGDAAVQAESILARQAAR